MNITIDDLWSYLTTAVTIATAARIVLNWLEGALAIWIPRADPPGGFWRFYDRVGQTLSYLAGSLSVYGRKDKTGA